MIRGLKRVLKGFCVKHCHKMNGFNIDLWEMYRDYIDGKREIAEINASFNEGFYEESDLR